MSAVPLLDSTVWQIQQRHPLLGMALLHHRTIRGAPMSFLHRPFQIEMFGEFGKIDGADICKAVQTGQSEMFTIFGLHDAGWLGRIFAYVMPTDRIRNRFVSTRINPLLTGVPEYRRRLPGADLEAMLGGDTGSLTKKRLGDGLMLFLGARTDGDFIELTADTFVVDEYDTSHAAGEHNLVRVVDRMKESPEPRHFRLGNPELPGGIEELFDQGDGRLYHWRCEHCGERQPIDWLANVVDRTDAGQWVPRDPVARADVYAPIRPVCVRCGRPFERRAAGAAWVPERPLRHRRSYRVTRFDVMSEPLRALYVEWLEAQVSQLKRREWFRRNAGRLYLDASNEITKEQVRSMCALPPMDHVGGAEAYKARRVTAGIDVGGLFHVTVSDSHHAAAGHTERRGIWTGTVETKGAVLDILRRYGVKVAVIDRLPETRTVEEIQEQARRFGCEVWLAEFHPTPRTTEERFGMRRDYRARTVRLDRTQLLDVAAEHIGAGALVGELIRKGEQVGPTIDGARLFPVDAYDALGFAPQITAARRIMRDGRVVWDEGSKPDHYRLADAYDLAAWEIQNSGGVFLEFG